MKRIIPSDPDSLLDKHQTAEMLGVETSTLEKWRREQRGPAFVRLGKTCVRYRRRDLVEFTESRLQPTAENAA